MRKLLSRKFLTSAAVTVAGIGTALGGSTDPNIKIAGLVVAAVATLAYNLIEGHIDAKSVIANAEKTLESIGAALEIKEEKEK